MKLLVKQTFHQSNAEMKTFYRHNKTQRHFCKCTLSKHEQPLKQHRQIYSGCGLARFWSHYVLGENKHLAQGQKKNNGNIIWSENHKRKQTEKSTRKC